MQETITEKWGHMENICDISIHLNCNPMAERNKNSRNTMRHIRIFILDRSPIHNECCYIIGLRFERVVFILIQNIKIFCDIYNVPFWRSPEWQRWPISTNFVIALIICLTSLWQTGLWSIAIKWKHKSKNIIYMYLHY